MAFMSMEFVSASLGTISRKTLWGLQISRDSAAWPVQNRNKCASRGSERGHDTRVQWVLVGHGSGEGMSEEYQSLVEEGRGESREERLETDGLVCRRKWGLTCQGWQGICCAGAGLAT
jgi:hypothetical protein